MLLWFCAHSRLPVPSAARDPLSYVHLAFHINACYARRHGYRLLFLQLREAGCRHPAYGARHPSYCKLAAVGEALARGYLTVLWLDSDAALQAHHLPLPALLARYRGPPTSNSTPSIFFAWDAPFSYGPNAGVMLWRATAAARRALGAWWQMDGRPFGLRHDYEQHALQWRLVHLSRPVREKRGPHGPSRTHAGE